jgi:hypothetical protein|tara:strand:+ start:767 stop:961 length:195 start_codon:yes stop_codon:yes gene_type:complete
MKMQKEYRIVWELDVIARNPEEAAKQALDVQRDPESDALLFYVSGEGHNYFVDLMENVLNGEAV